MAGEEAQATSSLETTPTWALALVCFVIIFVSLIFEHVFHLLQKFLNRRRKSLNKALYKIKSGVDHLQMLIFVLAFFHVLSCVLTFGLGMAKACFIRQFIGSVSKTDYFILRHGFIMAHFAESSRFDFQKFIRRALDKDFEVVVGMSLWVWIFAVLFIFFHAYGFYNYFWLPFIPLVTLLLVGTKLQVIITKMCVQSREESNVVRGTLLVKLSDDLFWFSRPQLLLHLMYFILFQNSFQLAFFSWTWMGSTMKKVVFTEQVIEGLKKWHNKAKRNVATSRHNSTHTSREPSPSYTFDTSLSEEKEFQAVPIDRSPSPDNENNVRDDKTVQKGKEKEIYNGEVSFGW
ncbi:hypothetical protein IFM89_010839 [Coptis chinensis]|uniref:MLO-like protein n=1 Tax=Coptis chinensis TaxID=261450 RepID=A0A835LXJ8_9MAGN|nr:hypothetical protein IFM89_010839 [Coptis chinensis]